MIEPTHRPLRSGVRSLPTAIAVVLALAAQSAALLLMTGWFVRADLARTGP